MDFYSQYIPYFEQRTAPLCTLTKLDMDHPISGTLDGEHKDSLEYLIDAICSDSFIACYNNKNPWYLLIYFSKNVN